MKIFIQILDTDSTIRVQVHLLDDLIKRTNSLYNTIHIYFDLIQSHFIYYLHANISNNFTAPDTAI